MKKVLIILAFLLMNIVAFSQTANSKLSLELSVGKLFSPYRFYKNHTGYENINLGLAIDMTDKVGISVSQSYSRAYSQISNNRILVMLTSINPYITFFPENKINLRISAGTGLLYFYTKSLYESYPLSDHVFGIPIHGNIAVFYNINDNVAINLNFDSHYSFLFNKTYKLIINDKYYFKTC
ncbi:MAG TPA: hypothetical protein PLW77_08265, partial [Bacteroidales bacterium]|nr:hypothetical protein [Bacteroidales bacterium]HQB22719.1 hypothetical protein [Bacteroidales bacterium]